VSAGDKGAAHHEGVQQAGVVATYLHGPVLVRNPALADLLLTRAVGPLAPYEDEDVEKLRTERLDDADPRRHRARKLLRRAGG
jgi:lipid II isoglutaminyl synthase (glutamine-hydrolysing)